ncbi:MAG: 3-hydroxyacyl-CoA dehydrogenase/enoyl-CoA hydratase family protein [bacterium]
MHEKHPKKSITWNDVEILVVGAGTMGASIAQTYAQNGLNVGLLDISDEILEKAFDAIRDELESAKGGIFSPQQVEEIKGRIIGTTSYTEACKGKNLRLVIETATEDIDVKKKIFYQLDKLCRPHVVLATNSSSLDTNTLARVTRRPDKVVWMHYFYLPHKNRAGEYAGTDTASPESIALAAKYMKLSGKVATRILSSRKGGAADIIFVSLLHEAALMIDEGYDPATIEAAAKRAFNMPMGFLQLMDVTGIPVGIYSMESFSDDSNKNDPVYKVYGNFFTPPESYRCLMERYRKANNRSAVTWVSKEDLEERPEDEKTVEKLAERFLAVGFMTATEVVDSGIIKMEDVDRLAENAFLWREGPFTIMNKLGMKKVMNIVEARASLAKKQNTAFPIPRLLKTQTRKARLWPIRMSPVLYQTEMNGKVARITISNPKAANALDNQVFGDLRGAFRRANKDDKVKVIIFDSAPIKTFIAGANVRNFVEEMKAGRFEKIRDDTAMWQDVLFHEMTGKGKPRIAIVDGLTFGGGVETALCFAVDPDSIVIATDRTSYTLPETRLGIFPGLRGTLTMPQVIYKKTNDPELAVAMARYYILAGGTATSSPRLLRYLGFADLIVPAHKRDEAAARVAEAIVKNKGKPVSQKELKKLKIKELPSELTFEEREELRTMKELFLMQDLIPTLYAYGRRDRELFFVGEARTYAQRIAQRAANNSPNAVWVSNWLISKGFEDFMNGVDSDIIAARELNDYLVPTFMHPDAMIGLTSLLERKFPEFRRAYPF